MFDKKLSRINEECHEVGKVICKIQRFGEDFTNPETGQKNIDELEAECADLIEVISHVFDINTDKFQRMRNAKYKKVKKWSKKERPYRSDNEIGAMARVSVLEALIREKDAVIKKLEKDQNDE